ncbi:glycosyltransferase family 25 protein [Photobacterium carnosum]|uniref:glycosyltransferase family 25 protein n=1 Tax=Photobacterium carnosum TaxID=2023717 RepID=UPI001E443CA2|nr:glycosyltransferase family 25 protein [Photobacterium carnosum]MCD9539149.1 hypothetical protein [Photobacterium carnosum]MCF2163637.1 hypothetical protein [Photobacterium carnosum]
MNKVIVLSLKDSHRRNIIKERLFRVGIYDFEFHDAFDARNNNIDELNNLFNIQLFKERYGREPAKGEIGCTISHLMMWEKISKSNHDNWIILEDDAIISPLFKLLFMERNKINGLVILGQSKLSWLRTLYRVFKLKFKVSYFKTGFEVGICSLDNVWGTVGYHIDKKSCDTLLSKVGTASFLADDWKYFSQFIDIWHVKPLMIREDYINIKSDISEERESKENA